jgi:hypothetical protein
MVQIVRLDDVTDKDTSIEINYCDTGLYLEITNPKTMINIVIAEENIKDLLKFLTDNYPQH